MTLKRQNLLHSIKCMAEDDRYGHSMDIHQDEAKELMAHMDSLLNIPKQEKLRELFSDIEQAIQSSLEQGGNIKGFKAIMKNMRSLEKELCTPEIEE